MSTETPRTDALKRSREWWRDCYDEEAQPFLVDAKHVEELETELAAAQAQIAGLREALEKCPKVAYREGAKIHDIYTAKIGPGHGLPFIHNDVRAAVEAHVKAALSAPPPPVVAKDRHDQALTLLTRCRNAANGMPHELYEDIQMLLNGGTVDVVSREEHERVTEERDIYKCLSERCSIPPERQYEMLEMLDAAGMGKPGSSHGNTLTGMVHEIIAKQQAAEQDAERLAAALDAAVKQAHHSWCECSQCRPIKEALAAHEARKGGQQ